MTNIVSKGHQMYSQEQQKISISSFDNKRFYADNGVDSYAYNHYRINKK
jgi:hypothetical protein